MKIALVHDYFTQLGGAERVAEALYQMLPNATVFATVANPERLPEGLRGIDIRTSFMQHLPGINRYYRQYFPLYPLGVANLDLRGYDLVVSSSSGYAKGVKIDSGAIHVCYCHTPTRWVWRYKDYALREHFRLAERLVLPLLVNNLRRWDENAARQPDQFVVNSTAVAKRVWDAYHRRAIVIPPPIDIDRFRLSNQQDDCYLILSRLIGYKRIDIAIDSCNRMKRRLVIIGDGPDRARLQSMAGPTVEFLGRATDDIVALHASRCRALLFPGEEDFGMVSLEVNAAGRPVIAYKAGGALDTVLDGVSGVFFSPNTSEALCQGIEDFESRTWNSALIRKHAEQFDTKAFRLRFSTLLAQLSQVIPPLSRPMERSAVA